MSDLISRQDAIKAIEDLPNCYNGFSDTYDKACIIGTLEELPSAPQWIPCEERLPIKDEPVFVYLFGDSPYLAWWNGRDWDTEDFTVDRIEEPVAWMPLPKPYEGKTE